MKKNEIFVKDNEIIPEADWFELVEQWSKEKKNTSLEEIKGIIKESIIERAKKEKVGVMFSGGIDSSLIAKVLIDYLGKENVVLVSVGCYTEERKYPEDLGEAKKISKELDAEFHILELSHEETVEVFDQTIKILKEQGEEYVNSVNVSVGAVEVAAYNKFKELKIKEVFGGLGSEEVFAGYLRHENSEDLNKTSEESIKNMWARDLVREVAFAKHFKTNTHTPLMDEKLLSLTFSMPEECKKQGEDNKFAVRSLGNDLGLSNAFRKKRAAQYGSRTQAFLSKECNVRGYKKISECLRKWP